MEGIYFFQDVTLKDTADNIAALIPQLTKGQLASFHSITLSDRAPAPLKLSADAFKELNSFGTLKNSQGFVGLKSLTTKSGTTAANIIISGSAKELTEALSAKSGSINFVKQISQVDIQLSSGSEISNISAVNSAVGSGVDVNVDVSNVTLSVDQLKKLNELENDLTYSNLRISDTQDNIQSLFSTSDSSLISIIRNVASFNSTTSDTVINLDWNNLSSLVGSTSIGTFINKVGVDSLVVSGTASELTKIFTQFGTDFESLPVGVEFKITDGGEIKLSPTELEKLDGRISGSVIVDELTSGYFDKNASTNVKDIEIGSNDLFLTVDQFRNAPNYLDKTGDLVIKDTSANITKALDFSVLDGRVDAIVVDDSDKIVLSVAQTEKLGDISVKGKSLKSSDPNPGDYKDYIAAEIVVSDRASAIASFIESGDFPASKVTLKTTKVNELITLDYAQTSALTQLAEAGKINLDASDLELKTTTKNSVTSKNIAEKDPSVQNWDVQTESLFSRLTKWMTDNVVKEVNDNELKIDDILDDTKKGGSLETFIKTEVDDVQEVVDDILIDTNEIQGDVNEVLKDTDADGHLETALDAYIKKKLMMFKKLLMKS